MSLTSLLRYAAPYRGWLALCAMFMLGETIVALALPWLGGRLAGALFAEGSSAARFILLSMFTLFALQALLKLASGYLTGRTSARVLADLRSRVYDHLQALPLGFFHRERHGDIVALVTHEVAQLAGFVSATVVRAVPLMLTAAGAIALMARIELQLTAVVVLLVPMLVVTLKLVARRLRPLGSELQKADAHAISISTENLSIVGLIKVFTRESFESARYRRQLAHVTRLSDRQHFVYSMLEPVTHFLAGSSVIGLLFLAAGRIGAGAMTPAQLVTFLLYVAVLTRPIATLAAFYGQYQLASGTLARLQRVLGERPETAPSAGRPLPPVQGDIEFKDVHFSYAGRKEALRGLSLGIAKGETVAITGQNGSGKSTLAHLLLRLHEPTSGQILVDGIDIATVSLGSLRGQVAIVPQHVLLLNGSVQENIAYGLPEASQEAIERAARIAQADEFVRALPEGYETQVGDNGVRLSGGQRQRIALARALLKNPRILILDEATSMFDPDGEKQFIEQARDVIKLATVIIVTHRPATLALADRTIKLVEGRIA